MRLGLIIKSLIAVAVLHGSAIFVAPTFGQTPCNSPGGPDVIVGDLTNPGSNYASSGGIEAFDIGTTSCNQGDQNLLWISNTNQHPVIGQNLYRLKDGRIEQIGQSWLKHGFTALTQNLCCTCSGQGGSVLGVGCSDPYCCGLNGSQSGLGPKWEVNPHTGVYPYPFTSPSYSGSIARRLQVRISDLDPAQNGGGVYYGEAQYVTPDDAAAGNQNNNVSYRQVTVSGSGSSWNIAMALTTQREKAAIQAWKIADPTVTESPVQIASDGLVIISSKATSLGGNLYHYEYAVYNMNSDRAIGSFSIPLPTGVALSNVGFHDVDYHSGDGIGSVNFDGTDWPATIGASSVSWATTPFGTNQNANAIRWGTLYNFRFDANASPALGSATMGLFKPGIPNSFTAAAQVPSVLLGPADCNNNTIPDATDISNGTSLDCNGNNVPDECETFPPVTLARVLVASGFTSPIYVSQPPGDSTRLFVVEQGGLIKIRDLVGNTTLATPFLDVSSIITIGGERGLLGLAFHPQYQSNGFFYVNYTNASGNTVVARYTVSGNPNVANAASQVILKTINQPAGETNHKAGCLQFGKDGMLYVGVGDGGGGNDQHGSIGNGQNTATLLGKMLRLDVNNAAGNYIPAGNPFVGSPNDPGNTIPDEIWAIGIRNPWRFSFDRLTGDMYIGDVGQDTMEEINFEPAGSPGGRNYGWRCMEGTACTGLTGCTCNSPSLTLPIHTYTHASLPAGAVSETGGYVYRGCAMPSLHGRYFYGDYGQNFIKSFRYTTGGGVVDHQDHTAALGNIVAPVSFGEDSDGELYVVSYLGSVYKIVEQTGPVCGNGVVEAGEQCDDNNNVPGDGCFNCQFEPGNNDGCGGATLVCTGTYSDTLVGATNDGAASCGTSSANPDKWFKYVAINSGTMIVSTCGTHDSPALDSGIDTVLSVHSGCPGTTGNQLACNDDGIAANCAGLDTGTLRDSYLSVPVTAGNTYFIRVSVFGGTPVVGPFTLNVTAPTCFPDCNNNGISDATDIANATSQDCNPADGIPDECQVTSTIVNYDAIPATPIAITDNNATGITHTFNVPDHGTIQDVNLGLRITHSWNGDLIVRLTHNGVTRTLIDRPGYTGTGFGFDNNGFDGYLPASPLLDDEGTGGPIESRNVAAGVTSPPSYTPNQTLAGFDGQDRFGVWTLQVSDNAGSDTGSLVRWLLQFTEPGVVEPCATDCNNNGIPDATDIANQSSADCDGNAVPDECQIAANAGLDCDGGPVGVKAGGASIFASTCAGCHNTNGQGGGSFPGPNIRNKQRRFIWDELLPPTTHPGGAHPEYTQQDFANLEAFLADGGSKGRPDNILDSCQALVDCNGNAQRDACELESGAAVDLDYDGVPDSCQCLGPATGDGNGDTVVNGKDIPKFVAAILAASANPTDVCPYDYSGNNIVGVEDLPGMISALLAP